MFVIVLRYLVNIDTIDQHRPKHLEFLDKYYATGVFIASGAQTPRYGGVIFAKGKTRAELIEIFKEDSYQQHGCAEYQIFEFVPTKAHADYQNLLGA